MSTFKRNHPVPKVGQTIEVTARHCSEKQRTSIRVGQQYVVLSVGTLANGTLALSVRHPIKKGEFLRVNAEWFDWQVITSEVKAARYNVVVQKVKDLQIQQNFTEEDTIRMIIKPLVLQALVWQYADKCMQWGIDNQVDALKKLCRAVRHIREEDEQYKRQPLRNGSLEKVAEEARRFVEVCGNDFTILYFVVLREYKRIQPDSSNAECSVNAIIGMLLVRFIDAWNIRMNKIIARRLGNENVGLSLPKMQKLYACLDAYAGDIDGFNWQHRDIALCLTILRNKLEKVELNVIKK